MALWPVRPRAWEQTRPLSREGVGVGPIRPPRLASGSGSALGRRNESSGSGSQGSGFSGSGF